MLTFGRYCECWHSKGTGVLWLWWFFGSWWWLRFRYPIETVLSWARLETETARSRAIPVPIRSWLRLVFWQQDHYRGNDRSVRNMSRAIPAVLNGIIRISARYIRFPCDAVNQANQSPICSDSWFSQCNLSDRLHTHCYKGAIWRGMRT